VLRDELVSSIFQRILLIRCILSHAITLIRRAQLQCRKITLSRVSELVVLLSAGNEIALYVLYRWWSVIFYGCFNVPLLCLPSPALCVLLHF